MILVRKRLIVLIFMYEMVGAIFSTVKETSEPPQVAPVLKATKPLENLSVQTAPAPITAPPSGGLGVDAKINEKLSALESSNEALASTLDSMKTELSSMSTNMTALVEKIAVLNTTVTTLEGKLDELSHQIILLDRPKQISKPVRRPMPAASLGARSRTYYLQAVIPGRAWLVAKDGSTLTVREGTMISGYGLVRLIDPNQGRVVTSSGQVIKFSQDDS